MTTYTFNPNNQTVSFSSWDGEEEQVSFSELYIRNFVMKHMSYKGSCRSLVPSHVWEAAYMMCDGFGKMDHYTASVVLEWDWSQVRDSSSEALKEVAQYLMDALQWDTVTIDNQIQKHLDQSIGRNPLVGVVPFEQIVF